MLVGVVASRSVGGLIGAAAAVLAVIVTLGLRWILMQKRGGISRAILVPLAVALAVAVGAGFMLRGYIYENLSFTMGRIAAIFEPPDMSHLPEFNFEGATLSISIGENAYSLTFPQEGTPELVSGGLSIAPEISDITPPGQEETNISVYRFTYYVPGFGHIEVDRQGPLYHHRGIFLALEDQRLFMVDLRREMMIDPAVPIPSWGFQGWETWGSNRGHIFSRSIPLLPQSLIIGSGSDTFLLRFPTHDIIGNARYHGFPYMLVDKAHNLYLQTALTTGMISALALIALFAYFISTSFYSLIKSPTTQKSFYLRLGILASVSAFSVSSLSTDSTVSSTPMFWIILGMGYAINHSFD